MVFFVVCTSIYVQHSFTTVTYMRLGLVGMCVVGLIFGGMFIQSFALTRRSLHLQSALA